jgi:clan AA aspartic protease
MINGRVNDDLEAIVSVVVRGLGGDRTVDAVVDTGFNGWLSLPRRLISELRLAWRDTERAILADDSEILVDLYDADVDWHDEIRRVYAADGCETPLIGMSLVRGSDLQIRLVENGRVAIESLP